MSDCSEQESLERSDLVRAQKFQSEATVFPTPELCFEHLINSLIKSLTPTKSLVSRRLAQLLKLGR